MSLLNVPVSLYQALVGWVDLYSILLTANFIAVYTGEKLCFFFFLDWCYNLVSHTSVWERVLFQCCHIVIMLPLAKSQQPQQRENPTHHYAVDQPNHRIRAKFQRHFNLCPPASADVINRYAIVQAQQPQCNPLCHLPGQHQNRKPHAEPCNSNGKDHWGHGRQGHREGPRGFKSYTEPLIEPVANGTASASAQNYSGVPPRSTVVVQLGVFVAQDEGQDHSDGRGQRAVELEEVQTVPVRVGHNQNEGGYQSPTDYILTR